MAERKISTRFAVEGEDQYKKSIADINGRLKTLKSELALVQSQYAGQENSMEALTAKGRTLLRHGRKTLLHRRCRNGIRRYWTVRPRPRST